jgi:hypothetical protein
VMQPSKRVSLVQPKHRQEAGCSQGDATGRAKLLAIREADPDGFDKLFRASAKIDRFAAFKSMMVLANDKLPEPAPRQAMFRKPKKMEECGRRSTYKGSFSDFSKAFKLILKPGQGFRLEMDEKQMEKFKEETEQWLTEIYRRSGTEPAWSFLEAAGPDGKLRNILCDHLRNLVDVSSDALNQDSIDDWLEHDAKKDPLLFRIILATMASKPSWAKFCGLASHFRATPCATGVGLPVQLGSSVNTKALDKPNCNPSPLRMQMMPMDVHLTISVRSDNQRLK